MSSCFRSIYLYIMGQCLPLIRHRGTGGSDEEGSAADTTPLHAHEHTASDVQARALGQGAQQSTRSSRGSSQSSSALQRSVAASQVQPSVSEEQAMASARRATLMQHLPTDTYTHGGKGDTECIICMEEMCEGDRMRFLPCMHSYHVHCIDDWLLRRFTCPSCLEPVEGGLLNSFSTGESSDLSQIECTVGSTGRANTSTVLGTIHTVTAGKTQSTAATVGIDNNTEGTSGE